MSFYNIIQLYSFQSSKNFMYEEYFITEKYFKVKKIRLASDRNFGKP